MKTKMWWPDICVEIFGGNFKQRQSFLLYTNYLVHFLYHTLTFVILHYKEFQNNFGLTEIVVSYPQASTWAHTRFKMEIVAAPPPSSDRSTHHWYICVSSCKCLMLVQPQSPPSNLCVLMSMLGDGIAAISTLKPLCVCICQRFEVVQPQSPPWTCVCVCVWSCQSLEVEEWDKGIVHNRAFSSLVIVGVASSILVAMVTVFI